MTKPLTKLQFTELKKAVRMPEAMRLLSDVNLDASMLERHLDALAALRTTGRSPITGYFPDVARRLKFDHIPDLSPFIVQRNLDVDAFGQKMHASLKDLPISGYTLRVRRGGETVYTLIWNWARRPQDTSEEGWQPTVKMHVASVSKLVTSMGIVKLLHEKGINADAPIAGFLPSYFNPGAGAASVTFRQLLTHTSGFRRKDSGGPNDGYTFSDFKSYFERGVNPADVGQWHYHNGNSIGLRIAMSVLSGAIDANARFDLPFMPNSNLNDTLWDALSINAYVNYITQNVFVPSFTQASLQPKALDSLAYSSDLAKAGWAADAGPSAGTAGWWLSVDEIMNIMNTYWQSDAIVPLSIARRALGDGFGLDGTQGWQIFQNRQDCFMKSGYWSDGMGRTQQCVVAFAPRDIELAVFVNSPVPGNNIAGVVSDHLRTSLA
jgi:Beta-lactamase